ncbi:MAG: multiubiquitin domain-containing protein [Phycisphaeraceae bacterium]|nr:multiubiquitin domain-containing protein [Phycisphaeraceae bacterium]
MSTEPSRLSQAAHAGEVSGFSIYLAGANAEFTRHMVQDPIITGVQILELAGHGDRDAYQLVQILPTGHAEELRLSEAVDLQGSTPVRVLVFKTDRLFRILINGRSFVWGEHRISGLAVARVADDNPQDVDVWLDVEGGKDRIIEPDEFVSLKGAEVERFVTRALKVKIFVNTREKFVHSRTLSYMEVVRLAYPDGPIGELHVYTVTYSNGPHQNPEGALVSGSSVHIKNGMSFLVVYTDKS